MSWDVTLHVPGVAWASISWNYTHNVNPMVHEALERAGITLEFWPGSRAEEWHARMGRAVGTEVRIGWYEMFDGRPGADGLRILLAVMEQWDAAPDDFRAMNPSNGWGSFDGDEYGGVRRVFGEMIEAATTEAPLVWSAEG